MMLCVKAQWDRCMTNLVEVRLHQLKDNVYILELPCTGWEHDVLDFHNVCTTYKVE